MLPRKTQCVKIARSRTQGITILHIARAAGHFFGASESQNVYSRIAVDIDQTLFKCSAPKKDVCHENP